MVLCQLIVDIVLYVIVHSKEILINESSSKLSTGISESFFAVFINILSLISNSYLISVHYGCVFLLSLCTPAFYFLCMAAVMRQTAC